MYEHLPMCVRERGGEGGGRRNENVHVNACGEDMLDPLRLEVQRVMSCHVGTRK